MTTLATHNLDEPDLLSLIADSWTPLAVDLADQFREACRAEALANDGLIHPCRVTARLKAADPDVNTRRISALWSTATGRDGYLDKTDDYVHIDGMVSRGNGGKSVRLRRWRENP